jgi:hypothetical protein
MAGGVADNVFEVMVFAICADFANSSECVGLDNGVRLIGDKPCKES